MFLCGKIKCKGAWRVCQWKANGRDGIAISCDIESTRKSPVSLYQGFNKSNVYIFSGFARIGGYIVVVVAIVAVRSCHSFCLKIFSCSIQNKDPISITRLVRWEKLDMDTLSTNEKDGTKSAGSLFRVWYFRETNGTTEHWNNVQELTDWAKQKKKKHALFEAKL